ncbi:ANTAR domain-containing protein [Nocardia exalbida]|uniref:ANTAR domain-containing protein n=1 Tax=Nocardia exalbida TaxID=290231 RepID=UPI0002E9FAA1|nr:ANTAR domain-containing protein [Nocardia exalbida]
MDIQAPRPPDEADRFAFEVGRTVIEQAKGMLMLVYGIGEQQAFQLLRSCSQHTDVRLRELAQRVLTELPTAGGQAAKAPLRVDLNRILSGRSPQSDQ